MKVSVRVCGMSVQLWVRVWGEGVWGENVWGRCESEVVMVIEAG